MIWDFLVFCCSADGKKCEDGGMSAPGYFSSAWGKEEVLLL